MVFGNNVIRRWFAQFCNSFGIKRQRLLTPKLPTELRPIEDIHGPLLCLHLQLECLVGASPLTGARSGAVFLPWAGLRHILWTQNQSPPQHRSELCMLFLVLNPLTQRSPENHLQFVSSILLCLWKFCKNNKL